MTHPDRVCSSAHELNLEETKPHKQEKKQTISIDRDSIGQDQLQGPCLFLRLAQGRRNRPSLSVTKQERQTCTSPDSRLFVARWPAMMLGHFPFSSSILSIRGGMDFLGLDNEVFTCSMTFISVKSFLVKERVPLQRLMRIFSLLPSVMPSSMSPVVEQTRNAFL